MEWILKKIVIVDYGMGNISSVYNALEFISPSNTKIYVSSERIEIKSADKIIFAETYKIQLVGNATIFYDDMSISSKEIIFNARSGEVLSDN